MNQPHFCSSLFTIRTEARPKATFTSPNDCKVTCDQAKAGTLPGSLSPGDQIKKGCWCTDEVRQLTLCTMIQ